MVGTGAQVNAVALSTEPVVYPDSDGLPMSDNTEQFRWIVYVKEGLEWLFADDPDVFVAGDLLWYPVEGDNKTRQAPDAMVAFGRRLVAPQVGGQPDDAGTCGWCMGRSSIAPAPLQPGPEVLKRSAASPPKLEGLVPR
jgi:hypothetical protein